MVSDVDNGELYACIGQGFYKNLFILLLIVLGL